LLLPNVMIHVVFSQDRRTSGQLLLHPLKSGTNLRLSGSSEQSHELIRLWFLWGT
jgi:hypothetical protein